MKIKLSFLKNLPEREKRLTVPTVLTLFRLLCAPLIVIAMVKQRWGIAFILIIVSALTDLLDGYIARRFNQKTWLGAGLDPVADKILVLSIYFTLAFVTTPLFVLPAWFVWLVLGKELLLIGGAFYLIFRAGWLEVQPVWLGKLTMAVQMTFIVWLFACYFFHWLPVKSYYAALGLVIGLVLSSLWQYAKIGLKYFGAKKQHEN